MQYVYVNVRTYICTYVCAFCMLHVCMLYRCMIEGSFAKWSFIILARENAQPAVAAVGTSSPYASRTIACRGAPIFAI